MNNRLFEEQLDIVIDMLDKRLEKEPEKPILLTLKERYLKAKNIIAQGEDVNRIVIKGGCRAYLDAYSDYMNPLLLEMDKAENLLQEMIVGL